MVGNYSNMVAIETQKSFNVSISIRNSKCSPFIAKEIFQMNKETQRESG